jgi:hypothetical protein
MNQTAWSDCNMESYIPEEGGSVTLGINLMGFEEKPLMPTDLKRL